MTNKPLHPDGPTLLDALAATIDAHGLLDTGQRVLLAVSGGRDSVTMLAAMVDLAQSPGRGYELVVAHLDHGLRSGSSADAAFVQQLADHHHLPCVAKTTDVASMALEEQLSVETAARKARYTFLARVAEATNCSAVATAHHRGDQVETILHRLIRGTHLRGLAGMPIHRPLPTGAKLIRPLLNCSPAQIAHYAEAHHLTWREDPTNAQGTYTRNAIRNELVPFLTERFNPNVEDAILRLAQAADEGDAYLTELGDDLLARAHMHESDTGFALSCDPLLAAKPVLQRYALRAALENIGLPMRKITAGHLQALAAMLPADGPAATDLPGPITVTRHNGRLIFRAPADRPTPSVWSNKRIDLPLPGRVETPCGMIVADIVPFNADQFAAHCRDDVPRHQWLDADTIDGSIHVRPWAPGDRFTPLGSPGSQSVSDFLTNLKLPAEARRRVMCVCDQTGIVCLSPLRIADRVAIKPSTRQIIQLELPGLT